MKERKKERKYKTFKILMENERKKERKKENVKSI